MSMQNDAMSAITGIAILKHIFWLIVLFVWMPFVGIPMWLETVRIIANVASGR